MDTKETVLVVDDDREIVGAIALALEKEGYRVLRAYDGMEALDHALDPELRLILMDVMMPRLDGLSAVLRIRERRNLPIIVLSAKSEESDKVLGLSMGADDYVVKPFGVPELLARIRTTLRRADRINLSQGEQKDRYQVKDLVVDTARHQVFVGSEEIHFTQNEFKILELLCLHAGKVLTYDFILKHVWGPYEGSNNQILRVNMANIRRKLKENPSEPKYILTELGIGYRMLEDS